ncbi:MAG: AAA family ATPase, partial [Gammaproteobacteria bacterium]|nr:AAA family ATPase [Gammaproteobacteria bacterium]
MNKKSLPTGIASFAMLRNRDSYYVDKTSLIRCLIEKNNYVFLSRPRRFGKSLLVSTIAALFEGQESLFKGLEIHEHWNWSITHPVVRLSFGGGDYNQSGGLAQNIATTLTLIEEDFGIEPPATPCSGPDRLRFLIRRLYRKTGQQVVMLVDEYDKP